MGRMMADPAFIQKVLIENAITCVSSLWYEAEQRGDHFFKVPVHGFAALLSRSALLSWLNSRQDLVFCEAACL